MGNCGLNVDREFDDAFSSVGPTTPSKSPARKQSLSSSLIPTGVSESRVHFYELVSQHHTDSRGIVLAGHILRWMDICACQSAEKHGSLSSVTLSMDDLTFDKPIYAGSTVEISAQVNNAFNTSMEVGVEVTTNDCGREVVHCQGYFTFVSLGETTKRPVKIPKVIPETEQERDNFIMAKERRAVRFKRKDMVEKLMQEDHRRNSLTSPKELLRQGSVPSLSTASSVDNKTPSEWTGAKKRTSMLRRTSEWVTGGAQAKGASPVARPMGLSAISMTKIVLPSDANHMGNTFGGNVMAWMDNAATVAALRHCRHSPELSSLAVVTINVDAMAFLGSSQCGDRITCYAQVNRAFGSTMEVGVRVEAQKLGGQVRHINTGYLTIMTIDTATNKPAALPKVEAETTHQVQQYERALGRRRLRMERKKLGGVAEGKGGGLAWTWSSEMSQEISTANIYGLLKVANDYSLPWNKHELGPGVLQGGNRFEIKMEVHKGSAESVMSIRISGIVSCEMSKMFALIMDVDSRKKWDMAIAGTEVREKLDDHNEIIWSAYPSMAGGGTVTDYSLLRTWRKDEDRYIVASRSVAHPAVPVSDEKKYVRGEVNPSGFILTPWIMDDGMGEWRDDEKAAQTSFDYICQLDEKAQKMLGGTGGKADGMFVKVMVGSIEKMCTLLTT